MVTVYVYVLDELADWEWGYVTAELHSKRFFKQDAPEVCLKLVGRTRGPVKTMGGLTITPDCVLEDLVVDETSFLLLPGAGTWEAPEHGAVLEIAGRILSAGGTVCGICGATGALANAGLLDGRPHTSNGAGYLAMVSSQYKGQKFYVEAPSVADGNLITAGSTGALLWTKQILARLDVFRPDTLEAWYQYFNGGEEKYFYALMETLEG